MIKLPSLLAAGAFACAATFASYAGAQDALTTELSAQQQNKNKTTTVKRTTTPNRATTTRKVTTPSGASRTNKVTTTKQGTTTRTKVQGPGGATRTKVTGPGGATKTTVTRTAPPPRSVTFTGNRQTFTATRARAWNVGRGTWVYGGRNYSYWRGGPYRVAYGNGWRTFVAVALVAPIVVGAATYYPYAYVSAPADVCEGITEDGCQLTWTEVETVEGGTAPQCVSYCPWQ